MHGRLILDHDWPTLATKLPGSNHADARSGSRPGSSSSSTDERKCYRCMVPIFEVNDDDPIEFQGAWCVITLAADVAHAFPQGSFARVTFDDTDPGSSPLIPSDDEYHRIVIDEAWWGLWDAWMYAVEREKEAAASATNSFESGAPLVPHTFAARCDPTATQTSWSALSSWFHSAM
jgi:hypothetical protein